MEVKNNLALNVFIARKCLGIKHHELVELSGFTRPVLSGIENSSINPTLDTLIKLADSLKVSLDMLFLSKKKFEKYQNALKYEFSKAKLNQFDIYFPENIWKTLLKLSTEKNKKSYSKVVKLCINLVNLNFQAIDDISKHRMFFLAVLGFVFQEDGFKYGIEFGIWLAKNNYY